MAEKKEKEPTFLNFSPQNKIVEKYLCFVPVSWNSATL
jgi:hypothetical protein